MKEEIVKTIVGVSEDLSHYISIDDIERTKSSQQQLLSLIEVLKTLLTNPN